MKRMLLLAAVLLLPAMLGAREVININREWRFFMNTEGSSERAYTVNLPHTWNNDALSGKRDYLRGIGNYTKTITAPASWSGKRVFIRCYGANAIATILVNGRTAGEHRGGYTAFAYEITDLLTPGRENMIWVMVNNSPQTDLLPTAGDMNSYGGCFRDMELVVTEPVALSLLDNGSDGVYIKPKKVADSEVSGDVELIVTGPADKTVQAHISIYTTQGDTVARGVARGRIGDHRTAELKVPFSIDNPVLWDGTRNPHMYGVAVRITSDGGVSDALTVRTGFRYYAVEPGKGFMLNGKPYPLKGVNVTQDRAMVGPALSRFHIEEDLGLIKEMGANAVRVMELPHNPYFYQLCDQTGMIVWSDLPWVGNTYFTDRQYLDTERFRQNAKEQLRDAIKQQHNHPSVVFRGIFSGLNLRGDSPLGCIGELDGMARTEDPSRITGATSSEDGKMNFVTDVVLWNHSAGWKEGYPDDIEIWLGQLGRGWKELRSAITYGAGGSIYQQDDSLRRPAYMGTWHPERWQSHFHERYFHHTVRDTLLWGVFVGNMFDYGAAGRDWGEGNGINDCGLVTFDRKYRKDAYYLYKANWSPEPTLYIAEKRWERRGDNTQDIRVYSNADSVELMVNGKSAGSRGGGEDRIFLWEKVRLEPGANRIEARGGELTDSSTIFVD